eukprot:maker-scaffold112_size353035-snap-gene-2.31 protein:Tk07404 transcript:maker-scaffold112_size353035-snap-gene-2.31-mRNA-1 annotation:"hypothetical protein L798_02236"
MNLNSVDDTFGDMDTFKRLEEHTDGWTFVLRRRALADFPQLASPNLIHSLRNWFLTYVLIKPYFDPDFDLQEFKAGARAAVAEVSQCLTKGKCISDLEPLEGLMSPDCLKEVRRQLSLFSLSQRKMLDIQANDIMSTFIYQIGIIMNEEHEEEDTKKQVRHVEITIIAHAFQNFEALAEVSSGALDFKRTMDEQGGPLVVNCRFIRDFTKGVDDQWTINALNYFY